MAEDDEPTPDPPPPTPVLPYRPGEGSEHRPMHPAHHVYHQFGLLAFGMALLNVGIVVGSAVSQMLPENTARFAASAVCCGCLNWVMSLSLSVLVAFRDSPGRPWALMALLINLLLLGVVLVFRNA